MRSSKLTILKRLLMVGLSIYILRALGIFLLVPYASPNTVGWSYYLNTPDINTIVVGNSTGGWGLDVTKLPNTYHAVNLCTQSQRIPDSFELVKQVVHERPGKIQHIILALDALSFTEDDGWMARILTQQQRMYRMPAEQRIAAYLGFMLDPRTLTQPESINILFPWIYYTQVNPPSIPTNVALKLTGADYSEAAEKLSKNWTYVGQGYGGYQRTLAYPLTLSKTEKDLSEMARPEYLDAYIEFCQWCAKKNIKLTVVGMPNTAHFVSGFKDSYPQFMRKLEAFATEHDALFIDLNQVRRGYLDLSAADFIDDEHINRAAAERVATKLGPIMEQPDQKDTYIMPYATYAVWKDELARYGMNW